MIHSKTAERSDFGTFGRYFAEFPQNLIRFCIYSVSSVSSAAIFWQMQNTLML